MTKTHLGDLEERVRAACADLPTRGRGMTFTTQDDGIVVVTVGQNDASAIYGRLQETGLVTAWNSRPLGVRVADPDRAPLPHVDPDTVPVDRLVLAWCMRTWQYEGARDKTRFHQMWRHVLECDDVAGTADFGTASTGACETCFYEYSSVLWWLSCKCGLLTIGTHREPYDLGPGTTSLPQIIDDLDDLKADYRDHWPYLPWWEGVSHPRLAPAGLIQPRRRRA